MTANCARTGAPTLIVNSSARVRIDIDTPTKATDAADSIVPDAAIVEDSRNACRSRTLRGDGNHCGTLLRPPTNSVDGKLPVEPTTLGICSNFSNNLIDGPEDWNRSWDGSLDDGTVASSGAVGAHTRPCGRMAPGATTGTEQQLKQNRNGIVAMLFPVLETKCQDNGKGGAATGTGAGHGSDGSTVPTAPTATTAIVRKEHHELHTERIVSLPTKDGRMDRGCNQSFVMNRTNSASKRKIECAASGVALNIAGPRYGGVGGRIGGAGAAAGLDPSMNDEIEGKTKDNGQNIFYKCL
jgi:hypothetical protein